MQKHSKQRKANPPPLSGHSKVLLFSVVLVW